MSEHTISSFSDTEDASANDATVNDATVNYVPRSHHSKKKVIRGRHGSHSAKDDNFISDIKFNSISNVKNHIYFYCNVTIDNGLKFILMLKQIEDKILYSRNSDCICNCNCTCRNCSKKFSYDKIYIHINSNGGNLNATWSIIGSILNCKIPIVTIIEGNVCSSASLIALCGNERWMYKHSYVLIHQLSDVISGKYEELVDNMANSTLLMKQIKEFYLERIKLSEEKLEAALRRDLYWNADICLKYGLIDKIK
jgi:ATP-dependent protease ClpP protease subunit